MITIDFEAGTYVCPFCGHSQAYSHYMNTVENGYYHFDKDIPVEAQESSFRFHTLHCTNKACGKYTVLAINRTSKRQIDIVPRVVFKKYPDYIPEQIRKDYEEANQILEDSPKAAATLLRRCLQGMIHDFWGISSNNLNQEISKLQGKISTAQWKALDGLRTIGNIGAHMEKDVNLIVEIDNDEAYKLIKLIEMLLDKWYIVRHEEEELLKEITDVAHEKKESRKR